MKGTAHDRALDFLRKAAQDTDAYPEDLVVMPLDYDLLAAILTRERVRILNHLHDHGPVGSLQELADALGRDKSAVSRDVSYLSGTYVEEQRIGRKVELRARKTLIVLVP